MNIDKWRALPLPLKCATWDASILSVIFNARFDNYGFNARVEVHPEYVIKALFMNRGSGTMLYTVCGLRMENGREYGANWRQDVETGAYCIFTSEGHRAGTQGGYLGHVPANCIQKDTGEWVLSSTQGKGDGTVTRYMLC